MVEPKFIHLRSHSLFSIGSGAISAKDFATFCKNTNSPAIAITDTNNMYGARYCSDVLYQNGIQPILGMEINVVDGEIIHKNSAIQKSYEFSGVLVLIAKNEAGYTNLLHLISKAYVEDTTRSTPYITLDELNDCKEGIIVLSGANIGPLGNLIKNNKIEKAYDFADKLNTMFQNHFYMELERHGLEVENETEPHFLEIAKKFNIPLVATNNAHFVSADIFEAFDAFYCIIQNTTVLNKDRFSLTRQHYIKSPDDMVELFKDIPEAVENTVKIAKRCGFYVAKQKPALPKYSDDEKELLIKTANDRLDIKIEDFSEEKKQEYKTRLNYEIDVIISMNFEGYFLIVADFINWAKENGIPVGPGRGSGAGSLAAYALGITNIDPMQFNLLFERFLNPERQSMPDFDIDFCQERRDEVIRYVQKKYGADKVGHVIAFGKLKARQIVKDIGRVLGMPYSEMDRVAKTIPARILDDNGNAIEVTIEKAMEVSVEFPEMIKQSSDIQRVVDYAKKMEGMYRQTSKHASGIVIGSKALRDIVPLYKDPDSDLPVAGFDLKTLEESGLIKFDFLGLRNLTAINNTINSIKLQENIEIDLDKVYIKDTKTFEMLSKGDTVGVFQLESGGMRNVVMQIKPDTVEEIIAIISLYRPATMDNIDNFIKRKKDRNLIKYDHPLLEEILKETYGIMVYQEQVMIISQKLAGYSLGQADLMRRAMGKKNKAELEKHRTPFVEGAVKNGVSKSLANKLFDDMDKFGGYGFNKSHAAAYALISFQTAYLKAHYAPYFIASSMSLDMDPEKLSVFINNAKMLGIEIELPSVNSSNSKFSVVKKDDGTYAIKYALSALKGMGSNISEFIENERSKNGAYKDIEDFVNRLSVSDINKRSLETLILSGALDCLEPNRNKLFVNLDFMLSYISRIKNEKESSQIGLFGSIDNSEVNSLTLKDATKFTNEERNLHELNVFGFFANGHPLDYYDPLCKFLGLKTFPEISTERPETAKMVGKLMGKKFAKTKTGKVFAYLSFSNSAGSFEVTAFSDVLDTAKKIFSKDDSNFLLSVSVKNMSEDDIRLNAFKIEELLEADILPFNTREVTIEIDSKSKIDELKPLISGFSKGSADLKIKLKENGKEYIFRYDKSKVKITGADAHKIIGIGNIVF